MKNTNQGRYGGVVALFLVLVSLFLWKADKLTALGLTGKFYYLVLIPLAAGASGFLFRTLQSYAKYSGRHFGGRLVLGGPAALFILIIILGYCLAPTSATFPLTVYVHGGASPQDLVLRNSGYVLIDLGGDRRRANIGEEGQALFTGVPSNFRGQQINVSVDADGYEVMNPDRKQTLANESLYLEVRRKARRITGYVHDEGGAGLPNASVSVAGLTTTSDSSGYFQLVIPGEQLQPALTLQALAVGYKPTRESVVPNSNDLILTLHHER